MFDPIFLIGSCALQTCPGDRAARGRWKPQWSSSSTRTFRHNAGMFFQSHQTQDSCRFSLCLSMSLTPWPQLLFFSSFLLVHPSDLLQRCLFQSFVSPQLESLSSCTTFPLSCIRCFYSRPKPLLKISFSQFLLKFSFLLLLAKWQTFKFHSPPNIFKLQ